MQHQSSSMKVLYFAVGRSSVMSVKRKLCFKQPSMESSARIVDSVFLLVVFSLLATTASGEISEETKKIVNKWAPKLWVHHEEFFKPSNVEYFLHNTRVQDQNDDVLQENPTADTILNGESTANYNLNTKMEIRGPQGGNSISRNLKDKC